VQTRCRRGPKRADDERVREEGIDTVRRVWFWLALTVAAIVIVGLVIVRTAVRSAGPVPTRPAPSTAQLHAHVRRLLDDGHRGRAIRLYRETMHVSAREARAAVEAIQYRRTEAPRGPSPLPTDLAASTRSIRDNRGMAAAVIFVREQTGMNLGEAQAFVRALE
jgi:hypothetical protein